MAIALLALMNAALLVLQLYTHVAHVHKLRRVRRRHETLVTSAPQFATASWLAIYALLLVAILCDVVAPSTLSLFEAAPHPNLLRLLFSTACIANCVWIWTLAHGYIYSALLAIATQWTTLWTLYVFIVFVARTHRIPTAHHPRAIAQYTVSELGIVLYTGWTCFEMMETAAVAMQKYFRSCLSFASYVTLLGVFSLVVNWSVVLYEDFAFGLLGVWTLVTVSAKNTAWSSTTIERRHDRVQENAVQFAVITATILTILLSLVVSRYEQTDNP